MSGSQQPIYAQAEYAPKSTPYVAAGDGPVLVAHPTQPGAGAPGSFSPVMIAGVQGNVLPVHSANQGAVVYPYRSRDHQELLFATYNLARAIRVLASISIFFDFLMFFISWSPLFLILMIGPLCGYSGAKNYVSGQIYVYLIFYGMEITLYIILMAMGYYYFIVFIIIEIWIATFVYRFVQLLNECSEDDLQFLRGAGEDVPEMVAQRRVLIWI
jgi:hypothetical protein